MKSVIFIILFIAICLPFTGEQVAAHKKDGQSNSKFTKHFNESLFKITEKRFFSVEILMNDKEYKIGKNVAGIVIHDDHDDDVEGAEIKITRQMPDGKVIKDAVSIMEKGKGLYIVGNLDFQREGRWELKIKAKKKNIEDTATFVFPDVIKKLIPAGKYDVNDFK